MKYLLRSRMNDQEPWSEPQEFETRRERDKAASFARIIGGIRTHAYDEPTPRKPKVNLDSPSPTI